MPRFPLKTFQQDAILKRLSMGLVALETTNIKTLSDSELDKLQCGDVVVKKTGEQEHAYVVTYKQDKHGICLTYTDASCVETQSYDYEHGHWVYNSQDVTSIAEPLLENITDAQGHKRFIEGDIEITLEGITQTYGKWSLSGTHLMVVLAGNIENGTTIVADSWCVLNFPDWIKEKIVPTFNYIIERKTITYYADDYSTQSGTANLRKIDNTIDIYVGGLTLTANRMFRIAFDLLIDNEEPQP